MTGVFQQEDIERIFVNYALKTQKIPPSPPKTRKKRVIVLAGPTCCGKSALALMLANVIGGEIVSADSMQVYRGMDIGTAKATKEERDLIPHHLLDICDITDSFNVVDFYYQARQACQLIHSRDNVPIVVGGSGFYLHALLFGPPSGPPSIPEVRQKLEKEIEEIGTKEMYDRLMKLDSCYAHTITVNDKHKIIRALEVFILTGKKISNIPWKTTKKPLNYDFRCWFLNRPRENLYRRIEKRCEKMVAEGLVEEVAFLKEKGLLQNSSASQAIGYRQTLDFLSTNQTRDDFRHYMEVFKQASRNYAKRQFTWFRKEPLFRGLDLDLHDPETAVEIILHDYESWLWER